MICYHLNETAIEEFSNMVKVKVPEKFHWLGGNLAEEDAFEERAEAWESEHAGEQALWGLQDWKNPTTHGLNPAIHIMLDVCCTWKT